MAEKNKMNQSTVLSDKGGSLFPLSKLLLDQNNPRFGIADKKNVSQADLLDKIVEKFGVDDVLSSLAVNGYFEAEPIVCRQKKSEDVATVVEGNRRLAACLIITGDQRASHQISRTNQFRKIWEEHGKKNIDPVPVIIFDADEQQKELLSYLGVRHIASAQPWDSYAKASWVARVVEENGLSVPDVALMIGDQHQTISRMLQGYHFIQQLINAGEFRPEDSVRRGRGSVTEYPFSWVYTILGYSATRNFLDMGDDASKKEPVKPANLPKASLVVKAMFGDKSKGKNAAISDSRELGELASALANPEKVSLLETGKTIEEINRLTIPIDQRLRQGLSQVREIQNDLISGINEQGLSSEIAIPVVGLAEKNRRTATELEKKIKESAQDHNAGDE